MTRLNSDTINLRSLALSCSLIMLLCLMLFLFSPPFDTGRASDASQGEMVEPLLSDGQFVWGPNVRDFSVVEFLQNRTSPLLPYAEVIETWAAYASVNPKILLAVLEIRHGWITYLPMDIDPQYVRDEIQKTTLDLAVAFYEHLYTWGARKSSDSSVQPKSPALSFPDGSSVQLNDQLSSGTYAIASILAGGTSPELWAKSLSTKSNDGFPATFSDLFPDTNALDTSNNIQPTQLPPDDFFQLPFPLGGKWTFNGPHSWCGGDHCYGELPDRSSIDFSTVWAKGSDLPDHYTVASKEGLGYVYKPNPRYSPLPCWIEIDHQISPTEVWTTSYYHLRKLGDPGDAGWISRNESLGIIGEEICNGGFANGAHVHFTLRYNGSLFDLDGVKLSGWNVHSGVKPYTSGYIERDGVRLYPYSSLINDYHEYFGHGLDFALHFHGNAESNLDLIKIRVDKPQNTQPGPPADVGYHDFTVEWWMKADPSSNTAPDIACGANDDWKQGNILFDRSHSTPGSEWGASLVGGRIAFGVNGDGAGKITLCSTSNVLDGEWHHIVIMRNRWDGKYPDGQLWLFVDGVLEGKAVGPTGDVSYPDTAAIGNFCGPTSSEPCADTDPFLFIGSGKGQSDLGYSGLLDELRFSWWLRYSDDFVPQFVIHEQDSHTVALLRFNEGQGDVLYDTAGFNSGTSNALRYFGGTPAGPEWVISPLGNHQRLFIPQIMR